MSATGEQVDLTLDLDGMTLEELETLEDYTGLSLQDLDNMRASGEIPMSSKLMTYFVWLSKHRQNPGYTIQQARQVEIGKLNFNVASKDDDAAEKPATKKKPKSGKNNAAR